MFIFAYACSTSPGTSGFLIYEVSVPQGQCEQYAEMQCLKSFYNIDQKFVHNNCILVISISSN